MKYIKKYQHSIHGEVYPIIISPTESQFGLVSILECVDTFNEHENDTYWTVFNPFIFDNGRSQQIDCESKEEAVSIIREIIAESTSLWIEQM